MSLLNLYTDLLKSANITGDDNGLLSLNYRDEDGETTTVPYRINGKRVILPTNANLRNGNWADQIVFHPLSEILNRSESMVQKKLRMTMMVRTTQVLSSLILQLTQVAANKDGHSTIPPKAQPVLSAMPDADERTVAAVQKLIESLDYDGERKLLTYHVRRGGKVGAMEYKRAAFLNLPLLEALKETEDRVVFGVKLRQKDLAGLKALIEYILPSTELPTTYGRGSNSTVAPSFDALVRTYHAVHVRLNEVIKIQKKQLEEVSFLNTDLEWFSEVEKMADYVGLIPDQFGNRGDAPGEKDEAPLVQTGTMLNPGTAAPTVNFNQPAQPANPGGTITVDELRRQLQEQAQPVQAVGWGTAPVQPQPVQAAGWGTAPAAPAPTTGAGILASMMQQAGMAPQPSWGQPSWGQPVQPVAVRGMPGYVHPAQNAAVGMNTYAGV